MTLPTLNPALNTPLAELLFSAGYTFTSIAPRVPDCSVTLLERISLQRQPFPLLLARQISAVTRIDTGSLLASTGYWTTNEGPMTRVPVPPDPLLGDPVAPFVGTETQPLVFPTPPPVVPELWVVGDGIGESSAPGALAINRQAGTIVGRVSFVDVLTPMELAYDGEKLWTFGFDLSGGASWFALIDPDSRTLIDEVNATSSFFYGICFEPEQAAIWACPSSIDAVFQYNADGTRDGVPLAIGPNVFVPIDVVPAQGLVNAFIYVTAIRATGNPFQPFEGRIFEVDAVTHSPIRSSTGTDLGNVFGIAVDADGNLWTCSQAGGGLIPPMICKTPISTFVSAQVALIDDPETLNDPKWFEVLLERFWFVEVGGAVGRLVEIDSGGLVLQSRSFAGSSVGHVATDGNFLWYSDKGAGLVHMLDPDNIATSLTTVNTGGAPDGLLALP